MEQHLSKDLLSRLKPVAVYQIISGIIALSVILPLIPDFSAYGSLYYILLYISIAIAGYSIFSGILLFRKNNIGLRLTLINQVIQLVGFIILGFTFQYASGIYLILSIDLTDSFKLLTKFGFFDWQIGINGDKSDFLLSFNLVALGLLIFIQKIKARAKMEIVERQIDAIGEEG